MAIWFQPVTLADLATINSGSLAGHIGIEFTAIGDDWLAATMPVDARTRQPFGLLHGGASAALAETIGSVGAMLCLDRSQFVGVGQSLTANHLRGVKDGTVTGTGRPVHRGRRSQVWEIEVRDANAALVCLSVLTVAVVPAP
jgi:1,4-dihydroxy-2-naphthoyl-CoA hydrolase